ncbi:hypothetical protein HK101_009234 [Irineochytrium annulatum]|nr:hypothetical protein HK101_009234 [Irineochytrium annulatum]
MSQHPSVEDICEVGMGLCVPVFSFQRSPSNRHVCSSKIVTQIQEITDVGEEGNLWKNLIFDCAYKIGDKTVKLGFISGEAEVTDETKFDTSNAEKTTIHSSVYHLLQALIKNEDTVNRLNDASPLFTRTVTEMHYTCVVISWAPTTMKHFHLPDIAHKSRLLAQKLKISDDTFVEDGASLRHASVQNRAIANLRQHQLEFAKTGNALDVRRLEALNVIFDDVISNLTTLRPLLSEVQREYHAVIESICNMEKEKGFLRTKIQKLVCDNGTEEMLKQESAKVAHLTARLEVTQTTNAKSVNENNWSVGSVTNVPSRLKTQIKEEEQGFVNYVGEIFLRELNSIADETQRMSMKFKGRKVFISEWLLTESKKVPIFEEAESLVKTIKVNQREIAMLDRKLAEYAIELETLNQKIEEIEHFIAK